MIQKPVAIIQDHYCELQCSQDDPCLLTLPQANDHGQGQLIEGDLLLVCWKEGLLWDNLFS